jgi:hypothetical protein
LKDDDDDEDQIITTTKNSNGNTSHKEKFQNNSETAATPLKFQSEATSVTHKDNHDD